MSDQLPSPKTSLPDFNHSAKIPDTTRIGLELQTIGDQRWIEKHKVLVERQTIAREDRLKELASLRQGLIEIKKNEILEEGAKAVHPALKHKYFARSEQQIRERAASAAAIAQVRQIENLEVQDMDTSFRTAQKGILSQAMSSHGRSTFQRESRRGLTFDFDQSHSKGKGR